MAAWSIVRISVRAGISDAAAPLVAVVASGNYFSVLGVTSAIGRVIEPNDEREAAPIAVLGHAYWRRDMAGDSSVLGRTLFLNGQPVSIVGVAPRGFAGTYVGVVPDVFVPITLAPRLAPTTSLDDRGARWIQAFARLAPGVSIAGAARELEAMARRISASLGERPASGALVMEARMQYLGRLLFPLFAAMLVITGLLLVIGAVNLGNLMLVRADGRRHETAVRLVLGASRGSLFRAVVAESICLAGGGGALGVVVALLGRDLIYRSIPNGPFPISLPIALDRRVLAFAMAASALVALICALIPAVGTMRVSPGLLLRASSRSMTPPGGRLRLTLIAGQIAFSLVCVTTAALFVRGLRRAAAVDVGFSEPNRVLLVNTDFAAARLEGEAGVAAAHDVLRRVRALLGVRSASLATMVPLGFGGHRTADVRVDGYVPTPNEAMTVERVLVGSDYARTMGIPLIAGRDVTAADDSSSLPVAVVNETFARRFWPRHSALGQRIDVGRGWATVVGVLHDGKYADLDEPPLPVVYLPLAQAFQPAVTLHVRVAGDPRALIEPVRSALRGVHADLAALQPRTLAEHSAAATFVPRVGVAVVGAFSAAALFLATLGVYATVAAGCAARAREIGLRIALGASRRAVVRLVLRQLTGAASAGIAVGAVLAVGSVRLLAANVPGLDSGSMASFAGATAVLAVALGAAAVVPLRRAWRTDPAVILRNE
jgi:predicted permease